MSDIAAIAGKLSEAQRAAIIDAMPSIIGDTFWYRRNRVIRTLYTKGLADHQQAPARLTAIARELRDHLISKEML